MFFFFCRAPCEHERSEWNGDKEKRKIQCRAIHFVIQRMFSINIECWVFVIMQSSQRTRLANALAERVSIIIAAVAGIALFGGIVWFAVTHPFGGENVVPIAGEIPKDFEKIVIDEKVAGEFRPEFREQYMKTFDETVAVLKEHPDSTWGWLDLGAIKKMFGDYKGAEAAWLYATALSPTHEAAYANLGDLYRYFLVDYKKAEGALLTLIEAQPTATRAYRDLAEIYRTQYTEKKGDAFLILEKGIGQNPDAGDLMALMALFYEQDGNYKKAIEWLERAKKFLPNPTIEEDIKRLKKIAQ